jgi:hypothetical protein
MALKLNNWRFYANDAAEPVTPLAAELDTPTLYAVTGIYRLRLSIVGATLTGNKGPITLEYSHDDLATWHPFGPAAEWDYANGLAAEGATVTTFKLSNSNHQGLYHESGSLNDKIYSGTNPAEMDFAIQPTAFAYGSLHVYIFRVVVDGNPLPIGVGPISYPNINMFGPQTFAFTNSGGAVAGGSTGIIFGHGLRLDMVGGAVAGGSASIARSFAFTMSGGAEAGGETEFVMEYREPFIFYTSGGAVAGGAMDIVPGVSSSPVFDMSGGAVAGGAFGFELPNYGLFDIVLKGGAVAGGAMDFSTGFLLECSGGAVAGGSSVMGGGICFAFAMSGGAVAGGEAVFTTGVPTYFAMFSNDYGSIIFSRTPPRPKNILGFEQEAGQSSGAERIVFDYYAKNDIFPQLLRLAAAEVPAFIWFWQVAARGMANPFTFTNVRGNSLAVAFANAQLPQVVEKAFNNYEVTVQLRVQ